MAQVGGSTSSTYLKEIEDMMRDSSASLGFKPQPKTTPEGVEIVDANWAANKGWTLKPISREGDYTLYAAQKPGEIRQVAIHEPQKR